MESIKEKLLQRVENIKKSKEDILGFTTFTFPKYEVSKFHEWLAADLNEFIFSPEITRMMLFAPPQHGKSELSTRRLPAYLLGLDPTLKIAVVCYNSTVARGFSKNVQDIIISDEYRALFPDTIIKGVKGKEAEDKLKKSGRQLEKNSYIFETTEGGYLISVGIGGALTSKTVDVLIMDDLYKGPMDAYSPIFRQRVVDFYNSVAETRLHNKSKQLILYTRWHMEDLAGVLLEKEKELWNVSKYEIIKRTQSSERDTREIGEALWEERHSKQKSERWRKNDPEGFEALGMQDPKPVKGLLYNKPFKTYKPNELPSGTILNYTDTADTGTDYLASVSYVDSGKFKYIVDMVYSQEPMELTLKMVAELLDSQRHLECTVESNNGGRGFARELRKEIKNYTRITDFTQTSNKEARILSNSTAVNDCIIFPEGWESKYPEVYKHLTTYMRDFKANAHDDIEDCLTSIVEKDRTYKRGRIDRGGI